MTMMIPARRNGPQNTQTTQKGLIYVVCLLCVICGPFLVAELLNAQSKPIAEKQGTTYKSPSGATLRLLIDESNIGPEVSQGELTFPPNIDSGDHVHGSIEILYVISGELEHFVNGKSEILKAGMVGFVKPPDKIRHKTGPAGAKVLVTWVPGEEAKKITSRWTKEP